MRRLGAFYLSWRGGDRSDFLHVIPAKIAIQWRFLICEIALRGWRPGVAQLPLSFLVATRKITQRNAPLPQAEGLSMGRGRKC